MNDTESAAPSAVSADKPEVVLCYIHGHFETREMMLKDVEGLPVSR